MPTSRVATSTMVARGVVAGLCGTVVMTAFQRFVEMPLTQRSASFAPADLAEKVTPLRAGTPEARRRLNSVTHHALGAMWGAAYGVAAARGLRGSKAVGAVFGGVYASDLLLNVALGLYHPGQWTTKGTVIDVVDKYVQALATGVIFDRLLDPDR